MVRERKTSWALIGTVTQAQRRRLLVNKAVCAAFEWGGTRGEREGLRAPRDTGSSNPVALMFGGGHLCGLPHRLGQNADRWSATAIRNQIASDFSCVGHAAASCGDTSIASTALRCTSGMRLRSTQPCTVVWFLWPSNRATGLMPPRSRMSSASVMRLMYA